HLKMSNPKCAAQNQHVRNIESKKNSIKEKSIKETNNLNLNLEEENNSNIEDIIWNLEVPMPLRQKIKTKIKANELHLTVNQILDIENAYHYQISKGLVIPDGNNDDDT